MLRIEDQNMVPRKTKSKLRTRRAFSAPEEVRTELASLATPFSVPAGEIIFRQGEPLRGVFLVEAGRVALSAGDDPTRVTRIAESGSLLGLPATMTGRSYSLTAETVTDTWFAVISPDDFRELLREKQDVCYSVTRILAEEIIAFRRAAVYTVR